MVGWLDRMQQRSRTAGFLMAVVNTYADDQGGHLAAWIAYYAFLSLFPLLLLLTTVLGVVLVDDPGLQQQVLNSALSQFPVIGDQLGQRGHLSGSTAGVVIGIAFALFGALGVGQAIQSAMDIVWAGRATSA
jgi:membrane protein